MAAADAQLFLRSGSGGGSSALSSEQRRSSEEGDQQDLDLMEAPASGASSGGSTQRYAGGPQLERGPTTAEAPGGGGGPRGHSGQQLSAADSALVMDCLPAGLYSLFEGLGLGPQGAADGTAASSPAGVFGQAQLGMPAAAAAAAAAAPSGPYYPPSSPAAQPQQPQQQPQQPPGQQRVGAMLLGWGLQPLQTLQTLQPLGSGGPPVAHHGAPPGIVRSPGPHTGPAAALLLQLELPTSPGGLGLPFSPVPSPLPPCLSYTPPPGLSAPSLPSSLLTSPRGGDHLALVQQVQLMQQQQQQQQQQQAAAAAAAMLAQQQQQQATAAAAPAPQLPAGPEPNLAVLLMLMRGQGLLTDAQAHNAAADVLLSVICWWAAGLQLLYV
jgi:hypothetical protein